MARQERLCSSVRLSVSSMPLRLAAMALRIAGPMTGNSASASGCGFWRTELVIASSMVGRERTRQLRIVLAQENGLGQHVADVARHAAGIADAAPRGRESPAVPAR